MRFSKKYLLILLSTATIIGCLSSCGASEQVVYLQDIQPDIVMALQEPKPITFMPGDKLNIVIHSRDKELVQMFNLSTSASSKDAHSTYTVDGQGQIDMPILGLLNVQGLTRMELQNVIKYKLLASKLIRDPIVSIEYADMAYYIIGESGCGRQEIKRDQITILEAFAEAGDLTINGRRDNVLVLRTINGKQVPYRVDLTNTQNVYSSPVYYLMQNDFIYIEPNETKANQASPNGNTYRTPTFWISMFNAAMTIALIFMK